MKTTMWQTSYAGVCGACAYEPITKEEKTALLERKEKILEEKLEHIRKIKASLASEAPAKEGK